MPQHSMQISRQSDDSQQASMMPQSMSQGQLQSSPISSPQQQQQASEVQMPHEACPRTMLQRVRNSQNKHARIQWTQQSSGEEAAFGEKTAFTLLFLLMSLFTDKLDWIFLCIFWETGADILWFSTDTCLAPWGIPFPLLILVWPPFFILPVSSLPGSCADVWSWGRRSGWVLTSSPAEGFGQMDWSRISPHLVWPLVAGLLSFSVLSSLHASWAGEPSRPPPASTGHCCSAGPGARASPAQDMGHAPSQSRPRGVHGPQLLRCWVQETACLWREKQKGQQDQLFLEHTTPGLSYLLTPTVIVFPFPSEF